MTETVDIGHPAPDFELPSDQGATYRLSDLRGRWVVLFFYPKAMTPGCTTEACGFRDAYGELKELGAEVLGISHDSVERLVRFRDKHGLTFPLLSDPEHRVTEAYGVYALKKMAGREYMGIVRSTFLIDPEGTIAAVWRKVRVKGHVDQVVARLKELSAA
ncbi:MAG TPA: thioredoxin-dependent thiol peroxidase [Acidobacteria bacterium]|nr:thioredoxin-dependent thiol peroxidase [Acidobacteriota bacterium]